MYKPYRSILIFFSFFQAEAAKPINKKVAIKSVSIKEQRLVEQQVFMFVFLNRDELSMNDQ